MSEATAADIQRPFGTIVSCGGLDGKCRKNLGELHFTAPDGIARFFECPKCGCENDFVNSRMGITRVTRPAREKLESRRRRSIESDPGSLRAEPSSR